MSNEYLVAGMGAGMQSGSKGQDICDRTRAFALRVIRMYRVLAKDDVGQILGKQLLRSGTSVGANVEEDQAAQSKADFVSKLSIALKEARETRYWLTLILESESLPANRLESIQGEIEEIIKILYTIIQNSKDDGKA
jgi:four helix bundle protein